MRNETGTRAAGSGAGSSRAARRRWLAVRAGGAVLTVAGGLLAVCPQPAVAAVVAPIWGEPGDIPVPGRYLAGSPKDDFAIYRPSTSTFWVLAPNGQVAVQFLGGDIPASLTWKPVPADYDGDGLTDFAVFHGPLGKYAPSRWQILLSRTGTIVNERWGGGGIPAPADYDGDGAADMATFGNGLWSWKSVGRPGTSSASWGRAGDIPFPGRYDVDASRRADLMAYRPTTGEWLFKDGFTGLTSRTVWGEPGDIPVAGKYQCIPPYLSPAVFRPSEGTWWIATSQSGPLGGLRWGEAGDIPLAADLVGDMAPDLVVWRPSTGTWWVIDLASFRAGYPACTDVSPN